MNLFDELNHTTAAYCRALGLDAKPYESRQPKPKPAKAASAAGAR